MSLLASESKSLLIDARDQVSYAQLDEQARQVARRLLGDRPTLGGARVAILVKPGSDFVAAFVGTILAGGCAVVLSPLHPAVESAYFCEDSGAIGIIVSNDWREMAQSASGATPLWPIEEWLPPTHGGASPRHDSPSPAATPAKLPIPRDSDPALQLYTSGTTGKPKGAVLSYGNLVTQQRLLREAWGMTSRDVLLHVLPLHHMHGLCIALLNALGAGAGVRFIESFDARRIWEEMAQSSVFMAVPTIYSKLLSAFDVADTETQARWRANASALRLATSGSAALPVTLAERWRAIAGRIPLERFGMSELGVALSNPLDGERRAGTVGLPLPTVDARVVAGEATLGSEVAHADDTPKKEGKPNTSEAEQGELWIAGPSVFSGYHGRPDATAQAFVELDGRRWFKTGDTVTRDERGYFKILGRTSVDILKSGGYKLSALEIEEVLREHPLVGEVAVVGVPDEVWGDRVVACVVVRAHASKDTGASASRVTDASRITGARGIAGIQTAASTGVGDAALKFELELRDFVRSRMAPYKVPKQIVFVSELPRNAMGKVVKPELVRLLQTLAASS